jgi:DNA-binding beta-propeller fold protein YncE
VATVSTGFQSPAGLLFDGANIWATDIMANTLLKLDGGGAILQTVTVGTNPALPAFDGGNLWVPNYNSNSVSIVRASTGAVLATLTGNGLNGPVEAAFDGQRVLVTNNKPGADVVSLFKAADFTFLGVFATGAGSAPGGACSDGIHFWIALQGTNKLARF